MAEFRAPALSWALRAWINPAITLSPPITTSASTAVFRTRQSRSAMARNRRGTASFPPRPRSTAASRRSSASGLSSFFPNTSICGISRLRQRRTLLLTQYPGDIDQDDEPVSHLAHAGDEISQLSGGRLRRGLDVFSGHMEHFVHAVHDEPEQLPVRSRCAGNGPPG